MQAKSLVVVEKALEATKDASAAANLAATVGIIMAIIAFLQVFMFGWQLRLMRRSNTTASEAAAAAKMAANTTQSALEASHRPWIKAELNLVGDFVRNKDGDRSIPVEFTMRNIGNSVAQCVYPHPGFFVGEGFVDDILKAQLQLASKSIQTADSRSIGFTIFPGELFKVIVGIPLTVKSVVDKLTPLVDIGFANSLPHL